MRSPLVRSAVVGVVLVALPAVLSDYRTAQLATAGAYFVAIIGLDVLLGHAGRVSLAQGAFMAVGGYTTAVLVGRHGIRDVVTIPAAAAVAGGIGLLAGIAATRVSGRYLPLATFSFAVAVPAVARHFDSLTGGAAGLSFVGSPHRTGHGGGLAALSQAQWLYALTSAAAVLLLVVSRQLLRSRFGRSLRAVRDGERAATASGINRHGYRIAAFGLSAAYAGVAGSLVVIGAAQVTPGSISIQLSLYLLVGATLALHGSIAGALAGALLVEYLPGLVARLPRVDPAQPGPVRLAFGVLLIGLVLLLPLLARFREGAAAPGPNGPAP